MGRRALRDTCTVPRFTTAGRTRSATWTKADCSASAVLMGDGVGAGACVRADHQTWAAKPAATQEIRASTRTPTRAVRGVMKSSTGCGLERDASYGWWRTTVKPSY